MNHPLQCKCGTLKGRVSHPERAHRGLCYCRDCQAFAHLLDKRGEILDALGGSDVIAVKPASVSFTQGMAELGCMRLSDKGMLRWYARCCNTPIGNTPPDFRTAHVGLLHNCLEAAPGASLDSAFGPVTMWVNTQSAKGKAPAHPLRTIATVLHFLPGLIGERLSGRYRQTPFFDASGVPVVAPTVLSRDEHETLVRAVQQASSRP